MNPKSNPSFFLIEEWLMKYYKLRRKAKIEQSKVAGDNRRSNAQERRDLLKQLQKIKLHT